MPAYSTRLQGRRDLTADTAAFKRREAKQLQLHLVAELIAVVVDFYRQFGEALDEQVADLRHQRFGLHLASPGHDTKIREQRAPLIT